MKTIRWIDDYMRQAEGLVYEGQVGQALSVLENLLFEEPGYAPLHNMIGWAYMYYAVDEARAEKHFRVAMEFDPDYAPPYLHLGTLFNKKGRVREAVSLLREGLTKPQAIQSALLEGIGQAYEMQSEYRSAIRAYKEAATKSVVDYEVDRMLLGVKRCRRKRIALYFSFW